MGAVKDGNGYVVTVVFGTTSGDKQGITLGHTYLSVVQNTTIRIVSYWVIILMKLIFSILDRDCISFSWKKDSTVGSYHGCFKICTGWWMREFGCFESCAGRRHKRRSIVLPCERRTRTLPSCFNVNPYHVQGQIQFCALQNQISPASFIESYHFSILKYPNMFKREWRAKT